MKVARIYKTHDIRLVEEEKPKIKDGYLLTRVRSVGVCGSDVHWYQDGHIGPLYLDKPLVLGHEMSAEVVEIGNGVKGFEVGMPLALEPGIPCGKCEYCVIGYYNVCPNMSFCGTPPTDGAYLEYMLYPPRWAYPLPEKVSYEEGTLAETLAVAIHAVDLAHMKVGKSVAIFGVGPIGLCALQMAKLSGASDIFVVDPLQYRIDKAMELGASAGINPTEKDPVEEIKKLTGNRGVDVAIESAGVTETPNQCAGVACPAGRVVLIGIPAEDKIGIEASLARRKGLSIMIVRRMVHTYNRSMSLINKGLVDAKTLVSHRYALDDIKDAFELVEGYSDGVIKAVINV